MRCALASPYRLAKVRFGPGLAASGLNLNLDLRFRSRQVANLDLDPGFGSGLGPNRVQVDKSRSLLT